MHKLIICHWSVLAWRFTFGECPWQGGMLAFVFCWSIINYNKILGQGSFDSGVYKNSQQTYQCSLNQKFINQIVTSKNGIKAGKLRDLNLMK